MNQITFYFFEEGQGCGSEDIKKFFLLFCLFDEHYGWKNHNQLNRTALK